MGGLWKYVFKGYYPLAGASYESWFVYLANETAPAMTKEAVVKALNTLPENFNINTLMEKLIFIEKVEEGFVAIERGEFKTHEEVKEIVKSWRK